MVITQLLAKFKKTWNIFYLFQAIYLILIQGRLFEVIYGLYNYIFHKPSSILSDKTTKKHIVSIIKKIDLGPDIIERDRLMDIYSNNYAIRKLPTDFEYCRKESIIENKNYIILGQYNQIPVCQASIVLITATECIVNNYYNNRSGFLHIHSLFKTEENKLLVATGDKKKFLDMWEINENKLKYKKRIKYFFGGFTAIENIGGRIYFGSDYSGRPNYIESSDGKKYFFPLKAYKKWVSGFFNVQDRFIVSINTEVINVKNKKTISIFDTKINRYVYCEYLDDFSNNCI